MNLIQALRDWKHQRMVAKKRRPRIHRKADVSKRACIGENVSINWGAVVDADAVIGDNVSIGPGAYICTFTHELGSSERRAWAQRRGAVTVGDGSWVGAKAVVLPGVTIAPGCVIGAGAVVTKDTEPDGVYVGVPARRVRDLD